MWHVDTFGKLSFIQMSLLHNCVFILFCSLAKYLNPTILNHVVEESKMCFFFKLIIHFTKTLRPKWINPNFSHNTWIQKGSPPTCVILPSRRDALQWCYYNDQLLIKTYLFNFFICQYHSRRIFPTIFTINH